MNRFRAEVEPGWDLDAWRKLARAGLCAKIAPEDIDWDGDAQATLLAAPDLATVAAIRGGSWPTPYYGEDTEWIVVLF